MMRHALALLGLLALVAAGCGGGTGGTSPAHTQTGSQPTPTQTGPATPTTTLHIYLLHAGRVQPVARTAPKTAGVAAAAMQALIAGPISAETQLGLSTAMPSLGQWSVGLNDGLLRLDESTPLDREALAQVVFTLTQFPTVKSVEISGKRYTRPDFEGETPIIAVESPLPFQHVTSPLRATGTANTFEATFDYELADPDGKVVATHFVTATSGSGERGTFDFTVPYTVARAGLGELIVFERSAKDGSRIHINEIPIYLDKS